jgi:hypothetical protein
MVSESLLRTLDTALQGAGNKRNAIQSEVNNLNFALADATANFQRAQNQEANAVAHNDHKKAKHRELLDYYNNQVDKSGLGSVLEQIEVLAREQHATHRVLGESREIRMQAYREQEQAKTNLAVAQSRLTEAVKEWQRMSAEVEKARNEP